MKPSHRISTTTVKFFQILRTLCLALAAVSAVPPVLADELMSRLDMQLEAYPQEKIHVMTDRYQQAN